MAVLPSGASGQDSFGAAVAVTGPDEVVVLKPGALRGPSQAISFRRSARGWERAGELGVLPGGLPGERLTPTLTADAAGRALVLGSGDPRGAVVGNLYRREGAEWTGAGRIPVEPGADPEARLAPTGLEISTLMALVEPPLRRGALGPDGRTLAAVGGAVGSDEVRLLRHGDGGWTTEARLEVPPVPDGGATPGRAPALGGRALAYDGARVVAGAPEAGHGGAAALWSKVPGTGMWRFDGWVRGEERDARFGSAVSLGEGEVLVGAPGRGTVVIHRRGARGSWGRSATLGLDLPPGAATPNAHAAFGAALALAGDHLAVGAPQWDGGRGAVVVFRRTAGGEWRRTHLLAPEGREPGAHFGEALHIGHGRLAVGAPGSYGGRGRAAVYTLDALEAGPAWLEAGETLTAIEGGTVTCRDGAARGFACDRVDLVAFVPLSRLGAGPAERVSDLWGWTDGETGRDYVLVGRTAGLAVVEITDPGTPQLVAFMPANASGARDIKVYRDHAFMTGDGAGEHGLLVLDLTRLRDLDLAEGPIELQPDARYDEVASAHNLVIDTESGFAYTVGSNTGGRSCGGGLHMIDIRDPLAPTFAGCFTDSEGLIWSGRTHDAQCTVYRGPDSSYQGRQICFAANETAMRIVDVTDKENPAVISGMSHPGTAYVHQGWLTEDQRYLYVNDELDEIVGTTDRTRTLVWDVAELDDPVLVAEHLGPDRATDHNLYIAGERAYLANYQAGFRLLDISDPESPVEIGWFDTTPYGPNPPGFTGGAWTAFPFFDSGTVAVSSMNEGLFLLRPRPILP